MSQTKRKAWLFSLLVGSLVSGCGGGGSNSVSNPTVPPPDPVDNSIDNLQVEEAFPNLTINDLVGLYQSPDDSSRWYAMSQSGSVYWFNNTSDASQLHDFVDLTVMVRHSGEQGLLGMAFDPGYSANGRVYFSYVNHQGQSIIARLIDQGTLPLDTADIQILFTLSQPAGNHNGGQISFGPDGYLYIGLGDGGGGGDTYGHGQNTQTLLGTMMRVDVSGDSLVAPADNPFVGNDNILDEIYAYGLRNPWRWSFDRQTGELWVADVGQNRYEEVNIVQSGDNLGWPIMEGNHCFNSSGCDQTGLRLPVAEYNHDDGDCSVTGGYVYRGDSIVGLQGHFVYGDFCTGTIRTVVRETDQSFSASVLIPSTGLNIASFAQGADGEVLVLDINGKIYQLVQ